MREDVTLDFVNRISVLPLENNTDQKYAAELARDVINTQILAMNIFDVVDKGIVDSVLHEEAIEPGSPVSQIMLSRLGQRLNVQSIMVGSVDIAGDKRIGSVIVPEMSLTLRLIEIKSGVILWQGSGHYAGDSIVGRLFGITPDDAYKVTARLAKRLLSTIPERQNIPVPLPAETEADKPVVVKPVSVTTDVVAPAAPVVEGEGVVDEQPVPAEPVVEGEGVVDEPVPAEPVVEGEGVVDEPVPAEPVVEGEPAVDEQPVPAEPVVEGEGVVDEPVPVEPVVEGEGVVDEPVPVEPVVEGEPAVDESVPAEPVMEDEPAAVVPLAVEP